MSRARQKALAGGSVLLALGLAPIPETFAKDGDSIDPRSIQGLGNHRSSWDGSEPIYYWSNLGEEFERRELAWVFAKWSEFTPLRFEHLKDRKACEATRRCIKFVKQAPKSRCAAIIGRRFFVDDEVQESSPEYRCAGSIVYVNPSLYCKGGSIFGRWMHGAMLHEVGHALGLFHEHQRYDRDAHIEVFPSRITRSGQYDIVPISGKSRIERKDDRRVEMPLSTTWGPYNTRSVMHYWRKHKTNNGLVTLAGAPSLFALHMTKLQGSDVANVMAVNFPNTAFLIPNADYRSTRTEAVDTGGPGLWKLHRARGGATQSMVIPAGVELTVFNQVPWHRFVPGTLQSKVPARDRFLFKPAVTLYSVPRYNGFMGSLGLGKVDLRERGLVGEGAPKSLVVGSGLSLRACFEGEKGKVRCRRYSSRALQFIPDAGTLQSLEVSLAVTIWNDTRFLPRRENDRWGAESFVPRSKGRMAKFRPKSRKKLSKHRNRSMYVPPGLVAKLCPASKNSGCEEYSNQGIAKLAPRFFDKPVDLRVYPAATFFAGPYFDDQGRGTWSIHKKGQVQAWPRKASQGSVIVGPGVSLKLCTDETRTRCCAFDGGSYGAHFSSIRGQCPLEVKSAVLEKAAPRSPDKSF